MPDLLERLTAALADRYAIESEIGRGGMATVYLAQDLKHRRKVAIKVLHPELAATLGSERFLQEIEIVAGLQHPHILPLYDSGEAEGLLYYVMPYARGESLRHRLDRERQLAVDESVRIAVEVADALDYAHRQGVVHRDIKPGNILLAEGHATIADFGIARAVEVARRERLTSTGLGVGTPLYSSPEQATAQETLDGRTDIYSLGCVLYEMLAGEPPLTGATPQIIHARRVSETPSTLHGLRDTVPPALDHVIARALARVPADRYATASQFGQAMQAAIFATTPAAQVSQWTTGGEPVAPPLTESRGRWKVGLPLGLGAAAVIAVALWIAAGMPGDTPLEIRTSNILQVTRGEGVEFHPALSPDGKDVAFTVGPIGNTSIVVRSAVEIGSGGEARLAQDEPGHQSIPAWNPDGASLRFRGFSPASGWNWKEVGKLGGSVRTINRPYGGWNRLSPDGSRVVYSRRDSIFAYAADHGEPELLGVHRDRVRPGELHAFDWSPDGRRIAYVNGNSTWWSSANVENSSIWVLDAEGGEPVRVTDDEHLNMSPQWLGDSRRLLFVSDRDGPRRVYAVEIGPDRPLGSPGSVSGASDPHTISVSADGRKLAFSKFTTRQNIWSVPVPGSGQVSVRAATPITSGNQIIETHSLSPEGEWIAYDSDIRGEFDLYKMPLEGGTPDLIVDISGTVYKPTWSPDGTEFAFYGQPQGAASADVFVVPAAGGAPEPLTGFPGIDGHQAWSPDGLVLAFMSQGPEGLGAFTIWTVSRDSVGGRWSEPVQLHDTPCLYPAWAPDGEDLVCDARADLVRVSRGGEVLARLVTSSAVVRPRFPVFSPDGSRIYFHGVQEDGSQGIWWIPPEGGIPTKVVALDDPAVRLFGPLTVDLERLYFVLAEYDSDIWVLDLDW